MGEPGFTVAKGERRASRSHAFALRMLGRIVDDCAVGLGERHRQDLRGRPLQIVVDAANDFGSQRTGDFAGGVAAHSVRHQREAALACRDILILGRDPGDGILVQLPHQARIGAHGADNFALASHWFLHHDSATIV